MVLLSVVHSRAAPPSALPLTRTRTPAPRTRRERRPSRDRAALAARALARAIFLPRGISRFYLS